MKKGIKMKKINIVAITTVLFFMFLIPVFANDTADLQKLQPLSPSEQSMYEQVKNNAPELHKFIATRMYVRTLKQVIKFDDTGFFLEPDINKFPSMPEDFDFNYCDSLRQGMQLFNIKNYQDSKKNSK